MFWCCEDDRWPSWMRVAWVCCSGAQGYALTACIFFLNPLWINFCKHEAAFSDTKEKTEVQITCTLFVKKAISSMTPWKTLYTYFPLFPYFLYRIMAFLYKLCSLLHSGKMAAIPLCIKLYFRTEKNERMQEYFLFFFSCILAKLRCIIYLPFK